MRRLWGRASSSNVQKVLWALDELGLAFEHEIVGGPHGGMDRPDFRALTPVRRVPVLEDGAVTVWESHAILRHLARSYPGPLTADTPQEAALVDQWLDFALATWQPPMIVVFWELVRIPLPDRSPARLERALEDLHAATAVLDQRLAQSEWLAGSRLTMADIGTATLLYRYYDMTFQRPARPALDAYYARVQARPGFRNRVMTSYDELRAP